MYDGKSYLPLKRGKKDGLVGWTASMLPNFRLYTGGHLQKQFLDNYQLYGTLCEDAAVTEVTKRWLRFCGW
jgi:hypothetical protein